MPPAICTSPATLTSFRYAVHHLPVNVFIFLGHELCCEVKPTHMPVETLEKDRPTQWHQALKCVKVDLGKNRLANL